MLDLVLRLDYKAFFRHIPKRSGNRSVATMPKNLVIVYLKLFGMALFWGGTFIAGRIIAKDVGPYAAAFLRFLIASVFLLALLIKHEHRLPSIRRSQVLPLILLGLTGVFAYNVFFFKGLKLIEAGRAAIIIANNPILIALCSALLFKETLTTQKAIGILLSVTGAVIAISKGNPAYLLQGGLGWGEVFIGVCVLSWVTFSLIGKTIMSGLTPLVSVTYSAVIGAAALFIPACYDGLLPGVMQYGWTAWVGVFYLGFFGTVLGFVWYYEGIQAIGPTKAGLFINFVPISAIVMAFIFLSEPLTLSLLGGAILVSTGVYLTNAEPKSRSTVPAVAD